MSISCNYCGAGLMWCPECGGMYPKKRGCKTCGGSGVTSCHNCARVEEAREAIKLLARGRPFKLLVSVGRSLVLIEYATRKEADYAGDRIVRHGTDLSLIELYPEEEDENTYPKQE